MNIELMMKAVNELKGDLASSSVNKGNKLYLFLNNSTGSYIAHNDKATHGLYTMICTCDEFNQLITELSNWQPTLPKVGTVEADGMAYEIGKLYLFSDNNGDFEIGELCAAGDINDGNGFMYQSKVNLRKSNKYEWWSKISKIDTQVGTITPAPVRLIDGAAYELELNDSNYVGYFDRNRHSFFNSLAPNRAKICGAIEPKNITRLVPEVK